MRSLWPMWLHCYGKENACSPPCWQMYVMASQNAPEILQHSGTLKFEHMLYLKHSHSSPTSRSRDYSLSKHRPASGLLIGPFQTVLQKMCTFDSNKAYPGPDLRTVAAKVADQSRGKSRKVAEGRRRSQNKENGYHTSQSFTIISNNFDKVALRRKPKSRKVAEGRTKSRNVACNLGDLQVQDRPQIGMQVGGPAAQKRG
jgi:hypothetical protein